MPEQVEWRLPAIDSTLAAQLAERLGVPPVVARILVRRGYTDATSARIFLEPSLEDLLDPLGLKDMPRAVARLSEAVRRKEQVLLFGDYDADGIVSVAILKTALDRAGACAGFQVPSRLREGYGLRTEVVEQAAASGVRLLISADTGIRAGEAIRRARELGLDVIVTDHHLPEEALPPALAVLNPKQPDCPYPFKDLCGAGVAFKLVQALVERLGWSEERRRKFLQSLLKLVAIATVADVVPLVGENRILVKHGLEGLRSVKSPGLRALLAMAGLAEGEVPSAHEVAFRVAPRMNAAGRMADASQVIELLLTADNEKAQYLAAQLQNFNQDRQRVEVEIIRSILEECERTPPAPEQAALVFAGRNWHRGVLGIVASRLVERFYRPVIVLSIDPETGLAHGSGRSIPPFHLLEALESMADLFVQFGGHRQAAGMTLEAARVDEFREKLDRRARRVLLPQDLVPALDIDTVTDVAELDEATVEAVLRLAPFGFGNPRPVLALLGVRLASDPVVLKQKHVRLAVHKGAGTLNIMAWGQAESLEDLRQGQIFDVAFSLEEDRNSRKRGYAGWTAVLRGLRFSGGRS